MTGHIDTSSLWDYQRAHNPIIARYCAALGEEAMQFLPIHFFRDFELKCGDWIPQAVFQSSGTTGQQRSRHLVRSLAHYHITALQGFQHFYGHGQWTILGLLPSYLERTDSSLVEMVRHFINEIGLPGSGFYLDNFEGLHQALLGAVERGNRIFLIGVSYALLDFVDQFPMQLPLDTIVMETGGMKGKRSELTRPELHALLRKGLGVEAIHSEYGMTELLSQAYSLGDGRFACTPTLEIHVCDPIVPNRLLPFGQVGRICIVDHANVDTCAFIATDDIGRMHPDGNFEVLGRMDHSELRGCNLMYERP